MNAFAPLPSDLDPSADARRERLRERQLQMLDRLAEVGLQIAEAIGQSVVQTVQDGPVQGAPDDAAAERRTARLSAAALAYGRAARAVRMTLALQSKLADAAATEADSGADDRPGALEVVWMEDPSRAKAAQVKRVQRLVRRVAQDGKTVDAEALERLAAETAERLQDEDLYGDLLRRPIGEVLAHICRDLGLDPDWASLTQEPWVRDEIRSGAPASPFAPWMPGETGPPPQCQSPQSPLGSSP